MKPIFLVILNIIVTVIFLVVLEVAGTDKIIALILCQMSLTLLNRADIIEIKHKIKEEKK